MFYRIIECKLENPYLKRKKIFESLNQTINVLTVPEYALSEVFTSIINGFESFSKNF